MKKVLFLIGFVLICQNVIAQTSNLGVYWDDGLKIKSEDGAYKFSLGGRVHYDLAFITQSAALDTIREPAKDIMEIRRARLSFEGLLNKAIAYEFEFTFGETLEYADMYVAFLRVPKIERLTIGHFREPFGMEELTSSNAIVFMERSLTSAFGPSRNAGIMVQKQFLNEKLRAFAGAFRITDDFGADRKGEGRHSYSIRLAYNPVYDTVKNKVIHFGLSSNMFKPSENSFQVKTENEVHTAPAYINTGKLPNISRVHQLGGEFGYSYQRLTLQGEYIHALARQLKTVNGGGAHMKQFSSYYAMASYFLSRGQRRYNTGGNKFSSIAVEKQIEQGSMRGAWEVGLRLSRLNLINSDEEINKLQDITLGLNWYYNSTSRLMLNYVYSNVGNNYYSGALQFRVQVTF